MNTMILGTYLQNLLPWIEQVTVIALVGALLPVVFQVRHPRTQLAYCHMILVLCLLLPFLQPWRHPVVMISGISPMPEEAPVVAAPLVARSSAKAPKEAVLPTPVPSAPIQSPQPPFWRKLRGDRLLLGILTAGVLGRLSWLVAGLWHIRRYRIAATPLYPIPEAVQAASALTHADALFCISSDVPGPVMLGVFRPVVLLPNSFLGLDEEAQCGIAAHELLHVKRKDWLVTVLEEVAGALLWFNPAVWWLLAQTRLAREQLVDAEAVRLTSARESYIQALLAIARARPTLDLAPAPLFLRRRHLTQRMHALLKEISVSKLRLFSSYGSIAVVVAVAGWLSFTSFPLVGAPQLVAAPGLTALPSAGLPARRPTRTFIPAIEPLQSAPLNANLTRPSLISVPPDVQEPVTGSIQTPATPDERAAAFSLLERARQNSDLHIVGTPPFRLDATFLASGNVSYVGSGTLSETWISGQRWSWTANLGDYAQVRIGRGQIGFDEQRVSAVPIRVHMLRGAIFWPVQFAAGVRLRTAAAQWNGKSLTCLLMGGQRESTDQSRLWAEQEYCVDNSSGLLQIWSPAPGAYVAYDYSNNHQFHGRFAPNRITAAVGGVTVLDAQIAIADAPPIEGNSLIPTPEMLAAGPGITLAAGQKFLINAPGSYATDAVQTVIVHAELARAGNVLEEEVSTSADPRLSQNALDLVRQHGFPPAAMEREVYVSVGFVPVTQ
jgi:beta-lactamase regulating signal transducer with metallopeptidase domain